MTRISTVVLALAILVPGRAWADPPETAWSKAQEAFAAAIEKGHRSTVALDVKAKFKEAPVTNNPMQPGAATNPNYNKRPKGVSSGVVIDKEGYILTSFFNVDGKVEKIDVIFPDGQKAGGKLLGWDESKDIALIKVNPEGLQLSPIEWSDEKVEVGAFVMALGRAPDPERGTATRGIVSAVDRLDHQFNQIWEHSIQFDAKTNYGNSGGALVDIHGRLVGTVAHVRLVSPWGQNSGISFSTPVWKIREVLDRLKKGEVLGKPQLPFLGVAPAEGSSADDGVVLGTVQPGTAAANAGMQPGDLVLSINDVKVKTWTDFIGVIKKCKVGDKITLVIRREGKEMNLEATLGARPN